MRNITASRIVKLLKEDQRLKRLHEAFDSLPRYQLDCDALQKELLTIHKIRESRVLNSSNAKFLMQLQSAATVDQGHRSRIAEIRMEALRAKLSLEKAMKRMREYMLMHYAAELKYFGTKDERITAINRAMSNLVSFCDDAECLIEMSDVVLTDIDKASWTFSGTILKAHELNSRVH